MTIQRQYSLPNCTLILEGLGDSVTAQPDARPPMSILVNVECHIVGHSEPLVGGRDFFESLIQSVSRYAQEFLSGVRPAIADKPGLVELHRINERTHRLSFRSPEYREGTAPKTEVDLTTVQLFDLVEAIDQFFSDSQTLPDLSLNLAPLARRDVRAREPVAKRAVPTALGVSSLVAAAALFFWLPSPKVQEPKDLTPQQAAANNASPSPSAGSSPNSSPSGSPSPTTSPTGQASTPPEGTDPDTTIVAAPAITDPAKLQELEKGLSDKVSQAWKTPPTFKEDLVYRVSVSGNGDIVGYKYASPDALTFKDETPLPDLYTKPTAGSTPSQEPIAQFRLVLTPDQKVQVSSWQAETGGNSVTEITDAEQLKELQPKLYDQIDQTWKTTPTFEQELVFRVRQKADGSIADYTPINQPATDYAQETPLPKLGQLAPEESSPTAAQEPLALFKVVFKPNGVLQVSPWRGYRE